MSVSKLLTGCVCVYIYVYIHVYINEIMKRLL